MSLTRVKDLSAATKLTVDTNTLKVDEINNHVGIGTSTPAKPLSVNLAGGGDFIAEFQNTTDATPYGIHVKDAASPAAGYPLLQVTNSAGSVTYFRVDSETGRVTKPQQPSFKAMGNGAAYIDTTPVAFPTVSGYGCHNYGNHFNTSNGKFTCPTAGRYFFHLHMWSRIQSSTAACYPQLRLNQNSVAYSYVKSTGSMPDYIPCSITQILTCAANDVVDITFVGGSNSQYYNGPTELNFQGHLLG
jgi:hypothetical protein